MESSIEEIIKHINEKSEEQKEEEREKCDAKLVEMSYDFTGRAAVSYDESVDETNKYKDNNEYFKTLLYNLFNSNYVKGFFSFDSASEIVYRRAQRELGIELSEVIDSLRVSGIIANDGTEDNPHYIFKYRKFPMEKLFNSEMVSKNYVNNISSVAGEKNVFVFDRVGDEIRSKQISLLGKEQNENLFAAGVDKKYTLEKFTPEGIITEDGTFYSIPSLGQHTPVIRMLSLMGENLYNAIRVYNVKDYVDSETGMSVRSTETFGIAFSCLQDYIPKNYANFKVSDNQAKTMLALYNIAVKKHKPAASANNIDYSFQHCIENSTGLVTSHLRSGDVPMDTMEQNLKTIDWNTEPYFDRQMYKKHIANRKRLM